MLVLKGKEKKRDGRREGREEGSKEGRKGKNLTRRGQSANVENHDLTLQPQSSVFTQLCLLLPIPAVAICFQMGVFSISKGLCSLPIS